MSKALDPPSGKCEWEDLPLEVRKRIWACPAITLHDLAKLASLGKVFKEACLERSAADEQWLEDAAKSTFGEQADALTNWLRYPEGRHESTGQQRVPRTFHVAEGQPFPDLTSFLKCRSAIVMQSVRFLPRNPQIQHVVWELWCSSQRHREDVTLWTVTDGHHHPLTSIIFDGRLLQCQLEPRSPAHVLLCLGFIYLASKKSVESLSRWQHGDTGQPFSHVRVADLQRLFEYFPWSGVPDMSPDVQWAFTLLRMEIWISGHDTVKLSLEWYRWRPPSI